MSTPLRVARTALHGILGASLVLVAAPAAAATITVNSLADTSGGAECTLRDAISAANTDMAAGGCPAGAGSDTIIFSVSGTIGLVSSALPNVPNGSTVTIDGAGHSVAISGGNAVPVLSVSGIVTLRDLTIANGYNSNINFEDGGGAAVSPGGSLIVGHCTFTNNFARRGGGAINSVGALLDIGDSTFSGNSTYEEGGGRRGQLRRDDPDQRQYFRGQSHGPV
jgi:CSLREA domain-containing protein